MHDAEVGRGLWKTKAHAAYSFTIELGPLLGIFGSPIK